MQNSNTNQMIFSVGAVLAYISQVFTLRTGRPSLYRHTAGRRFRAQPPVYLQAGDVVEVEIDGLGVLRNPVVQG